MGLRDRLRAANDALNAHALQNLRAITPQDFARGADYEWFETRSGEPVTFDTVIGIQHVWACVTLLVNDVRKLPWDTFRDTGDGHRVPIDRPSWMVHPDPMDSNMRFRDHVAQAVLSLLVDGNAFIYAWPSVFNVELLMVLDPSKVDIRDGKYIVKGYREPLTDLNIRHVRNLVKPGERRGVNPIQAAREGFGLTLAAEQFGQRFFSNGAVMSGMIEAPAGANLDAKDLADQFRKAHDAKKKAHIVGVLTGGATFKQLSFSPEDTQFLALRQYQLEDAARLFHIPPFKIGSTEPGAVAYASTKSARIDYAQSAVEPIVVLLEDAYSDLIPGEDTYTKANLNALMRADPETRYASYAVGLDKRFVQVDEVRALEDMEPLGADNGGGFLNTPNNQAVDPRYEQVGSLVRAGYDPDESLAAVGLPPIKHLGLPPVTVQSPNGGPAPAQQESPA